MTWDKTRVGRLLQRASTTADERGAILGARLGSELRRLDPTFDAHVLGHTKLGDLLAEFPDIGELVPRASGPDFAFVFADAGQMTPVPAAPGRFLKRDLWKALVAGQPCAWLDLATSAVVYTHGSEPPDPLDAVRYLRVPPVAGESTHGWLRIFVEQHGLTVDDDAVCAAAAEAGWVDASFQVLPRSLHAAWRDAHRESVVSAVEAWMKSHGTNPNLLFSAAPRRPPEKKTESTPEPTVPARRSERSIADVRAMVHRAVDGMSEDELLSLCIPLRYVAEL
jgi:hypothetical protein